MIVFFSNVENLQRYIWLVAPAYDDSVQFKFISTQTFSAEDVEVINNLGVDVILSSSNEAALTVASELIVTGEDVILSEANIVPLGDWLATLQEACSKCTDMVSGFGRWYCEPMHGREQSNTKRLGFKFIDAVPRLIAQYIKSHDPHPELHAKQVKQFPVFFNWFSATIALDVKYALRESVSIDEFSCFLSDYLALEPRNKILYLSSLEAIEQKLLLHAESKIE